MRALIILPLVALLSAGCMQQEDYTGPAGLYAFAMTESTPAFFTEEDLSLFWVETRVEFPIRPPDADELAELTAMAAPPPFPSMPWVVSDDLRIEVDIVVSNLTPDTRIVGVTINGFNEFHEYMPGAQVVDDELIIDYSMWERDVEIGPNEDWRITIQERMVDEIENDLAAIVNGAPSSHQIVYFENQGGIDERTTPYIPALVPGLTGFRLGLRSTGAANIVCEASVRIRDVGDRLSDDAENPDELWVLPVPAIVVPMGYMPMP
jgi:hypothetical protein